MLRARFQRYFTFYPKKHGISRETFTTRNGNVKILGDEMAKVAKGDFYQVLGDGMAKVEKI